jgi:putative ABC transport system substrate-binding protein
MSHRAVRWIVALILGLLVAPLNVDAQPSAKIPTIGYLGVTRSPPWVEAFRQGLEELGYVDGKTIGVTYRFAEGQPGQLPALAAELVQLPVDVIVANGMGAAQAAQNTTTKIPIVMVSAGDPVAPGLVASLARPSGNVTGLYLMSPDLAGKRLQLLKEAIGSLARVAVLWNAGDAAMTDTFREIQSAAQVLGAIVQPLGVQEAKDIDSIIATIMEDRPDALFMITDVLTRKYTKQVVDFAAQRQLPTMFEGSGPVAEGGPVAQGGLMSYGPSVTDALRRAAYYVDRILKGAKPGDLPVEQPVKFELVINLKTAKALGITMPPSLVMLADRVIE